MKIHKLIKGTLTIRKSLLKRENERTNKSLDDTEYLLSSKANKEALMQGITQIEEGKKGKTMEPFDLWK